MPAYLIYLCYSVNDRKELEAYWDVTQVTFKDQEMKVLTAYTPFEVLEGDDDIQGVVIAEFPSYEACKAWYDSPGYVEGRQHRIRGAKYLGLLVDGGFCPAGERMPQTIGNVPA
ncbi:MAG: hypothetical protein JWR80_7616 [Bradyrhizobium sp.]|nr:hypothetical protein [Bradyrhizobium sp.]